MSEDEDYAAFVEEVERVLGPVMAGRFRQIDNWEKELASAGDDPEDIADVIKKRESHPLWTRDASALLDYVSRDVIQTLNNDIVVVWNRIAPKDRRVVISYLNDFADSLRGRSVGGRPRKTG
jgi:hypothetical protein